MTNTLGPVVVGVDGSTDSPQTVSAAAAAAITRGLPLRVVHARPWPTYSGEATLRTYAVPPLESEPEARRIVDEACDQVRAEHPDLTVTGHAVDGGPAVVLLEEAENAALLVVGSRGKGGFVNLLLGSTALDVAARATCPVLVVRGEDAGPGPVVVGIDGRSSSKDAIHFAFTEARSRGVPLRAVHTWHHSTNLVDTAESEEEGRQRSRDLLQEELREYRQEFPDVVTDAISVHDSNVARPLSEESAKAGLLVVGSRMRGPLRSRLLGSTGFSLAHTSRCPMVIVRPSPQS